MSKRKLYKEWQADPAVNELLKNVIRSSKKSYYRIGPDGKHAVAPVKIELMGLGISGTLASRLLQDYPFPVAEFIYNRKPAPPLPEAVLAARREMKALREQAKAVSISDGLRDESLSGFIPADKAKKESHTMKAIQVEKVLEPIPAIEAVLDESPSEEQEPQVNNPEVKCGRSKKRDPDEELVENGHHCLIQRGDWFGIFHTRNATVHLISKDKDEAVEVLARYGRVKECFRWN